MKKIFTLFSAMLMAFVTNATKIVINGPTAPATQVENALKTNIPNYDTIVLKAGTFFESYSDYVKFNKNVVILADEKAATKPIVKIQAQIRMYNGAKVKVKGIEFDGSAQGSLKTETEAAHAYEHFILFIDGNSNKLEFENCVFHDWGKGVNSSGDIFSCRSDKSANFDSLTLKSCTFNNNANRVFNIETTPKSLVIEGCHFEDFTKPILYGSTTTAKLKSCIIKDSYFNDDITAESAINWIGTKLDYLNIENCQFSGFTGDIITGSTNIDSCFIKNSTFSGSSTRLIQVSTTTVDTLQIDGCTFSGFSEPVIDCSATATMDTCIIKGSTFTNITKNALNLSSCTLKFVEIDGCTFTNLKQPILVSNASSSLDSCVIKGSSNTGTNTAANIINWTGTKLDHLYMNGCTFSGFSGVSLVSSPALASLEVFNTKVSGGTKFFENSTNSGFIRLDGCEVANYSNIMIEGTSSSHLDSCIIKNCYFHNSTGSAIFLRSSSTTNPCDKLHVINSTFANFSGFSDGLIEVRTNDAFHSDPNDDAEVLVDHCTFYSFIKNADNTYGCVDIRKSTKGTVSNCIFENPTPLTTGQYNECSTYMYGGYLYSTLSNNTSGHRSGPTTNATGTKTGDPLFANAASGNFHLGAGSPALGAATDGSDLGDPRWWTYGRDVIVDRFGTICLPYGVKAGTYSGATFYSIAGKRLDGSSQPYSLVLETVSGDLKAGQPYFFEASATSLTAPYDGTPAEAGNYKGLFGTLEDLDATAMNALVGTDGKEIYLLSSNTIVKAGTGCSLAANRAYIDMAKVPEYVEPSTPAPGIREIPMTPQSGTSLQDVENAETAVKFIENGRILILRDGITYDALGRVVR